MINLMLGDCLERMKEIPDGSVDLILADPPYLMTKQGKSCRPNYMKSGMSDNLFEGKLPNTTEWMKLCYEKLKEDSHFYVFTNTNSLQDFLNTATKQGFKLHNVISMIKDTKMPNRWYLKYTEIVLFFRKGNAVPINDMTSRDYEFVIMPTQKNGKVHISQKPLEFVEKLIMNSSKKGQLILDPFMGSGTTGVACVNTSRNFIGIEMDDKYFEIAKKRINETEK